MVRTKINDDEKILVKVDQNNLVYIDPNSVIDNDGNVQQRNIKQENLVVYVNLEADIIPRSILVSSNDSNTLTSIARGTLNFLKNQDGKDFDTTWTDAFNGTDALGNPTSQTPKDFFIKNTDFDNSAQSFGIESIQIVIKGFNAIPTININFVDVRGKTLFESPENSPYQAFFHIPWPIYYLTVKGFYGKAIKYRLHLVKFSSRFSETTGNFEISTSFVGSTFAYLNDIPLKGILNAPYMYLIETTKNTQTNNNTDTTSISVSKSSRGYATLKSIYSEYKQKGFIPKDFPVKTLRELIVAAQSLDKILEKEILDNKIDKNLFVGLKDFERQINEFKSKIDAWATKNLLKTSIIDYLDENKPIKYFELSAKGTTDVNKLIYGKEEGSLDYILNTSIKLLQDSSLFNEKIIRNAGVEFSKEKIVLSSTRDMKVNKYVKNPNQQYYVAFEILVDDLNKIINTYNTQKEKLIKVIEEEMNNAIKDKSNKFSIGFEPTIRNVMAVVLANADTYIRLLKEVHQNAIKRGEERKKKLSGLSNETKGDDSIYPWPEIKKQADGEKSKVIAYPGETDLIKLLGSDDYGLWPEVDFIENYIGVSTNKIDSNVDKEGGVGNINFIFDDDIDQNNISNISTLSVVDEIQPYIDQSPSSFLYEIWERALNITAVDSFDNDTLNEMATAEFRTIQEVIKDNDELITILKDNVKSETTLRDFLKSYSPFERYPYYQDQIPTIPYLKSTLKYPFKVEQYASKTLSTSDSDILITSTPIKKDSVSEFQKLNNNLSYYKPEEYRKNIYPFNSQTYLSYINKETFSDDELTFGNTYFKGVHISDNAEGFIRTPIMGQDWVKSDFKTISSSDELKEIRLFEQKIKLGNTEVNILNTPYFHKQLFSDFNKVGMYSKYVGSAYLLLNSLPFLDLEDKIKFTENEYKGEVRMSSLFREIGASHYIPYHLILKWGSIYHRYKKYLIDGEDIIDAFLTSGNTTTDIDGNLFFNNYSVNYNDIFFQIGSAGPTITYKYSVVPSPTPSQTITPSISQTPSITPSISVSASPNSSPTPTPSISITPSISPSQPPITPTPLNVDDIGIHPFYDAVFHQIINGYNHYVIESGSTSFSTNVDAGAIVARPRIETNGIRYWTTFVDNSKFETTDLRYTFLPSDGGNIDINKKIVNGVEQISNEDYDTALQNNFRIHSFDNDIINDKFSGQTFPSYDYYNRSLNTTNRTIDNQYSLTGNYRKVIDLIATFNPDILDEFESMFIDFSNERIKQTYESEISQLPAIKYTKFQDLLKELSSVEKLADDTTKYPTKDLLINEIRTRQYKKINEIVSKNIVSNNNLIKLTLGNPKEIDLNTYNGFAKVSPTNTFNYNSFDPIQEDITTLNLIKLYLGEDIDGHYLNFFKVNNVELSEENIKLFRSLILIYGGYVKSGGVENKTNFQDYIKFNIFLKNVDNVSGVGGIENRFSFFLNRLISNFTNLTLRNKTQSLKFTSGYETAGVKVELYNFFKSFNDKWIAGNSIGQRLLIEEFLFLDKANKDIGDLFYLNLDRLLPLKDGRNDKINLYGVLGILIKDTGLDMRALPAYVNFYGTNISSKSKITPSSKVAKNLFGTFLDVDYEESSPKIILQLTGPTSKHLADTNKKTYKFLDDSFVLPDPNNNPLIITTPEVFNTGNLYKSNRVVAFEVSFGDQTQGIFKGIQLDQNSIKNTSESFGVLENIARTESGAATYNVDIALFEYYRQASYTCEVTCMGNVMIQPTMFFYLKNVPMFRGSYWITEVTHNVKGNSITTTFKGVRIPYASLPDPKDSFTSSYRDLFDKLMNKANAIVEEQLRSTTPTTISIYYNGINVYTDPGQNIPNEDISKNLVQKVGITEFGVPFNGAFNEKYIQKINYSLPGGTNSEWLRVRVVQMGGPKLPLIDDTIFKLISNLPNTEKLLWSEIKTTSEKYDFYSTQFKIIPQENITEEKIRNTITTFVNPTMNPPLSITVDSTLSGNVGQRILTGPIGFNGGINEYSMSMSRSLMYKLKLNDGDIVYFQMKTKN